APGDTAASSEDAPQPVADLLLICREACDSIRVLVQQIYQSISDDPGSEESVFRKADRSAVTIADACVQELLQNHLLSQAGLAAIVGEEDDSEINILSEPYTIRLPGRDSLSIPPRFWPTIDAVRVEVDRLGKTLEERSRSEGPGPYSHLTAFIDPIDGTKEFTTGKGGDCSLCIGFASSLATPATGAATDTPYAGLVYRPVANEATYAMGCGAEGFLVCHLDTPDRGIASRRSPTQAPDRKGFLCSAGGVSPFIEALAEELDMDCVPAGGAGNKFLLLLEGKGHCYIQDRSVSRWDTCAAQAVMEAVGGILVQLRPFEQASSADEAPLEAACLSYRYRETETNLDFEPGLIEATRYSLRDSTVITGAGEVRPLIEQVEDLKPYHNALGLFCLPPWERTPEQLVRYSKAIALAKTRALPRY
ncbi:MAG: inositol monophosphatase family protein, partial [Myxococcota bacterium]|nr:inositol monophosphatase family protein [Myxococcota bacterium]